MKKSIPPWRMRRCRVLAQAGRDGRSVIAPRLPWKPRPCQRLGRHITGHASPVAGGPPPANAERRCDARAAPGRSPRTRAARGNLQHRHRAHPRLLPVHRDSGPRVRRCRGAGSVGARRPPRRRRDQRRVRRVQRVAQTLALTGCALLVIGRHDAKLALLAARGIETGRTDRVTSAEFDVAVECTGNPDGFAVAQRAVRPRGTLVLKSTYAGALTLDAAAVVVNELTLVGSRCGPFAPALRLLAEGRVAVEPLIHARYPLAGAVTAFEQAQRPGVLKVLLDIG